MNPHRIIGVLIQSEIKCNTCGRVSLYRDYVAVRFDIMLPEEYICPHCGANEVVAYPEERE